MKVIITITITTIITITIDIIITVIRKIASAIIAFRCSVEVHLPNDAYVPMRCLLELH